MWKQKKNTKFPWEDFYESLCNKSPVLLSDRVRIADYLKNVEGVDVFTYQDYSVFCEKVKKQIGETVNTEAVKEIFSFGSVKHKYHIIDCRAK